MNFEAIKQQLPNLHLAVAYSEKNEEAKKEKWLQSRMGIFTASENHRLMTYEEKNELPKGAETYVLEKVCQIKTIYTPSYENEFYNEAIEWGQSTELEAIKEAENKLKIKFQFTGENQKLFKKGKHIGATPDGLSKIYGLEVKCPNSVTHLSYKLEINDFKSLKSASKKYYWQIVTGLLCTNKKGWYFVSYDPRFIDKKDRLHTVLIKREDVSEDINKLENRLKLAIELKKQFLK